ncbi:MAG TPA: TonB-dependent receptor [Rhizomicrobium sp.]|nr:TonB-dependent receptor [Rhizomicrobium sp.]
MTASSSRLRGRKHFTANLKYSLLMGASISAVALGAAPAQAQSGSAPEQIIVTGTRTQGMTAQDSMSSIQVLGVDALSQGVGSTDLRQALGETVPSFTAQQYANDTAEFSLSAALRGVSPNDTLVLVNGKRRHYTGNLHVDAGFGAGSSSPDISLIPEAAIDHVEVLLDGAAAQYGTDAIAGVVNIILKDKSEGGTISTTGGQYYARDGASFDLSSNIGLPLFGEKGFVSLSGNMQTHAFTHTGGNDTRYINAEGNPVPVGTVGTTPNAAGIIACSGGNCIPTTGPYAVTTDYNYPRTNLINGDGEYTLLTGVVNGGYNFTDDIELYGMGTVSYRTARSHQNVRLPTQVIASPGSSQPCSASNLQGYNTAQTAGGTPACAVGVSTTGSASGAGVVLLTGSTAAAPGLNSNGVVISSGQAGTLFTPGELVVYPRDMEPLEGLREVDYQYNAGLKFDLLSWHMDANLGYGKDIDKVSTLNSGNRSLFIDTHTTPTNFYDGAFQASELTATLDASHNFNVGMASPLSVAVGLEAREDTYKITPGDPSSYYKEGPQSFPGFAPASATDKSRKNYAFYVDLALAPIEELQLDIAGRAEHFSDFGDTQIGKITARYDFNPQWAIRGTMSTGFRAPTLEEEYYTAVNVSPTSATVQLPANSAAAKILGLPNLAPEISTQFSAGIIAHPLESLAVTVDGYSLSLGNRIVASSTVNSAGGTINTPLVTTAILADGVSLDPTATQQGVTAFLNGISTLTQGVDITVNYPTDLGEYGGVNWTLAANYNSTAISKVNPAPATLLASNPSATFFNFQSLYNFAHAGPQEKIGLTANWSLDQFGATLRETYYGPQHSYTSPNSGGEEIPFNQAGVGLTDIEVRYNVTDMFQLSFGGDNVFNLHPDTIPYAPAICPGNGVFLIGAGKCVVGPDIPSNGQAETASNGAVANTPFTGAWTANGGYYYARITMAF